MFPKSLIVMTLALGVMLPAQPPAPNRVFSLDGINQYHLTVVIGGFNPNTITAEAWIRPDVPPAGGGPRPMRIVQKGTEGLTGPLLDGRFSLVCTEDGTPGTVSGLITWNVYLGSFIPNDMVQLVSPAPVPSDRWSHVAGTFSSLTGVAELYVDGVMVASTMTSANGVPLMGQTMTSTPQPVTVGGIGFASTLPQTAFRGQIDEVRLWNVARSAIDIAVNAPVELSSGTGLVDAFHYDGNAQGVFNMSLAQNGPRYPLSFVPGFGGGIFPSQVECQVNQPEASLDVDGQPGNSSGPSFSNNSSGTVNLASSLVGNGWDLVITAPELAVPLFGGGLMLSDGQIVNVDVTAPGLAFLNGNLLNPFPGNLAIPFNVPATAPPLCAQLIVTDATSPTSIRLSGPLVLAPAL